MRQAQLAWARRGGRIETQAFVIMNEFLIAVLNIVAALVQLWTFAVIIQVVLSWLFLFNVVNPYNPTVRQISYVLNRITEPVLRPIRNILPDLGGIDLSPLIALLIAWYLILGWAIPTLQVALL